MTLLRTIRLVCLARVPISKGSRTFVTQIIDKQRHHQTCSQTCSHPHSHRLHLHIANKKKEEKKEKKECSIGD